MQSALMFLAVVSVAFGAAVQPRGIYNNNSNINLNFKITNILTIY